MMLRIILILFNVIIILASENDYVSSKELADEIALADKIKEECSGLSEFEEKVIFIGPSGAGKSTLINYLAEHDFNFTKDLNKFKITLVDQSLAHCPMNSKESCTLYPQRLIMSKTNQEHLVFYDCPGFYDDRGMGYQFAITQMLEQLVISGPSKVMLVIDFQKFQEARQEKFFAIINDVYRFFASENDEEVILGCCGLYIAKCPVRYTLENFYEICLKLVQRWRSEAGKQTEVIEFFAKLIQERRFRLFHLPQTEQGKYFLGDSREDLLSLVDSLQCARIKSVNHVLSSQYHKRLKDLSRSYFMRMEEDYYTRISRKLENSVNLNQFSACYNSLRIEDIRESFNESVEDLDNMQFIQLLYPKEFLQLQEEYISKMIIEPLRLQIRSRALRYCWDDSLAVWSAKVFDDMEIACAGEDCVAALILLRTKTENTDVASVWKVSSLFLKEFAIDEDFLEQHVQEFSQILAAIVKDRTQSINALEEKISNGQEYKSLLAKEDANNKQRLVDVESNLKANKEELCTLVEQEEKLQQNLSRLQEEEVVIQEWLKNAQSEKEKCLSELLLLESSHRELEQNIELVEGNWKHLQEEREVYIRVTDDMQQNEATHLTKITKVEFDCDTKINEAINTQKQRRLTLQHNHQALLSKQQEELSKLALSLRQLQEDFSNVTGEKEREKRQQLASCNSDFDTRIKQVRDTQEQYRLDRQALLSKQKQELNALALSLKQLQNDLSNVTSEKERAKRQQLANCNSDFDTRINQAINTQKQRRLTLQHNHQALLSKQQEELSKLALSLRQLQEDFSNVTGEKEREKRQKLVNCNYNFDTRINKVRDTQEQQRSKLQQNRQDLLSKQKQELNNIIKPGAFNLVTPERTTLTYAVDTQDRNCLSQEKDKIAGIPKFAGIISVIDQIFAARDVQVLNTRVQEGRRILDEFDDLNRVKIVSTRMCKKCKGHSDVTSDKRFFTEKNANARLVYLVNRAKRIIDIKTSSVTGSVIDRGGFFCWFRDQYDTRINYRHIDDLPTCTSLSERFSIENFYSLSDICATITRISDGIDSARNSINSAYQTDMNDYGSAKESYETAVREYNTNRASLIALHQQKIADVDTQILQLDNDNTITQLAQEKEQSIADINSKYENIDRVNQNTYNVKIGNYNTNRDRLIALHQQNIAAVDTQILQLDNNTITQLAQKKEQSIAKINGEYENIDQDNQNAHGEEIGNYNTNRDRLIASHQQELADLDTLGQLDNTIQLAQKKEQSIADINGKYENIDRANQNTYNVEIGNYNTNRDRLIALHQQNIAAVDTQILQLDNNTITQLAQEKEQSIAKINGEYNRSIAVLQNQHAVAVKSSQQQEKKRQVCLRNLYSRSSELDKLIAEKQKSLTVRDMEIARRRSERTSLNSQNSQNDMQLRSISREKAYISDRIQANRERYINIQQDITNSSTEVAKQQQTGTTNTTVRQHTQLG